MVRQTVTKVTDLMTFGKFKGKSVKYILSEKPSYIIWLDDENIVSFTKRILDLAADTLLDELGYDPTQGSWGWDDVQD